MLPDKTPEGFAMSPVNSRRRPALAVLLGGFIVWQLGFILAANLLPLLHQARPPENGTPALGPEARLSAGGRVLGMLEAALGHWSNLTGQLQGWSLYAPFVPTQAAFVAVELRWDPELEAGSERPECGFGLAALTIWERWWPGTAGERVELHSAIEPTDPQHYFRPFCTFRLPAYEANLGLVMWAWDEDAVAKEPEVWRQRIADAVRRQWKPILAYLQWRLRSYEREHPDVPPPTQVILLARMYRIPSPNRQPWELAEPLVRPIARWRPRASVSPDYLPLESYDPAASFFEPLPIRE
jgi:hypothetical protein